MDRVIADDIESAVSNFTSVSNYIAKYHSSFSGFGEYLKDCLIEDILDVNAQSLKENICIDIFNRTTNIKLIDQYKAFQILSENWETITADLEMIQGEGFDAIFQVDPNMVVKKKKEDEDEVTEVQEGWKGHILPFELVQEEFHHGELFAIQSGEERMVEISNMYTEILESLEEDELEQTITNDDKNAFVGKEVKAYVTEALTDVESPEINALKNYLTLSFKKDKMAFIEENPFVAWSATVELLLRSNISKQRKKNLRKLMVYFSEVDFIDLYTVNWNVQYNRNNQTYRMLISICYLVVKGLLQTQANRHTKLMDFLDEQRMCRLYEKFILEYYRREFKNQITANASQIPWQLDDEENSMLPVMQSDIMLQRGEKVLIIDAKYYEHSTQVQFDKHTLHSGNLYQIFTYVKNKEYELREKDHTVSGMLFSDSELQEDSVIRKFRITAADGKSYSTNHYSLEMIIAVGFKVNSERAVQFRKWVNQIAKDYTIKGWVMDDERLKNGGSVLTVEYFDRLLEQIREIRLSERRFYQKITDIYATALDYDRTAKTTKQFFAKVQNKMHYAVHGHTAAELIYERADAEKPHMGLTTWAAAPEGKIVKSDVSIAKNYLSEKEMRSLERIVSAYLDLAEDRAERHIPMTMEDWAKRLDLFLMADDREVLQDAGKITAEIAKAKAETEFEKYRVIQDRLFMSDFDKYMLELEENAKK